MFFPLAEAIATELNELTESVISVHQQHTTACNFVVLQQQLLTIDNSLINISRDLEANVRQYIFHTQEQERLLQMLRASTA